MKADWERGFKRIAVIISALGVISFVAGVVVFFVAQPKLARAERIRTAIEAGDPDFQKLSKNVQQKILSTIDRDHILSSYPYLPLILTGLVWFSAVWLLFFLIRWVIKGFKRNN